MQGGLREQPHLSYTQLLQGTVNTGQVPHWDAGQALRGEGWRPGWRWGPLERVDHASHLGGGKREVGINPAPPLLPSPPLSAPSAGKTAGQGSVLHPPQHSRPTHPTRALPTLPWAAAGRGRRCPFLGAWIPNHCLPLSFLTPDHWIISPEGGEQAAWGKQIDQDG